MRTGHRAVSPSSALHRGNRQHGFSAENQGTDSSYALALQQCARGNNECIGELYADQYRVLQRIARRIARDPADDIVHDAFLQIIREAKSFDPNRGSARAWIYTIVRNTALRKSRRGAREVPVADEALTALCDRQSAHELPKHCGEYDGLRVCLESLDPKRRASLILTIVDGRTHAEVAELLNVPVGTVKAWIRRELIALRERLS
jgi:RNA polymerase sigma-70 factor (ECF subfamily)